MNDDIPHDTRRGSGRYTAHPEYAAADAIVDTYARARAIDAIRQRVLRRDAMHANVPSPHQIAAVLADAFALALDPATCTPEVHAALGKALSRALTHRGYTVRDAETYRRLSIRLRPQQRIQDREASARIAREVREEQERRRLTTDAHVDLLTMFEGIDEEYEDA